MYTKLKHTPPPALFALYTDEMLEAREKGIAGFRSGNPKWANPYSNRDWTKANLYACWLKGWVDASMEPEAHTHELPISMARRRKLRAPTKD